MTDHTDETEALRVENELLRACADQMYEALRLTREYVGEDVLPAIRGWSWYDAMTAYEDHAEAVLSGREKQP